MSSVELNSRKILVSSAAAEHKENFKLSEKFHETTLIGLEGGKGNLTLSLSCALFVPQIRTNYSLR